MDFIVGVFLAVVAEGVVLELEGVFVVDGHEFVTVLAATDEVLDAAIQILPYFAVEFVLVLLILYFEQSFDHILIFAVTFAVTIFLLLLLALLLLLLGFVGIELVLIEVVREHIVIRLRFDQIQLLDAAVYIIDDALTVNWVVGILRGLDFARPHQR